MKLPLTKVSELISGLMEDEVSLIRLASDNGVFDEETWTHTPETDQRVLYRGSALITQDQDVTNVVNTEGLYQTPARYTVKVPQDETFAEAVRGDEVLIQNCVRSPELNGERLVVLNEDHSSFRVARKILCERREERRQL